MTALLVFSVQLLYVLLLGLQSRNVYHRDYGGAAVTSACLGVMGLYLTGAIAKDAVLGGSWLVRTAYVAAGPVGITLAIWLHPKIQEFFQRCGTLWGFLTHRRTEIEQAGDEDLEDESWDDVPRPDA